MATRRYRQGLAGYKARTAQSAFRKKSGPRSDSKEGRRQATKAKRRGKLPAPSSAAAARLKPQLLPVTEEVRWLKRAALDEAIKGGPQPYTDELKQRQDAHYRRLYSAQEKERRADRPKAAATFIWVRRHKRRRVKRKG